MPSVDIITLNWNRKDVTRDLVESFFKHTHHPCRIIIIDQASTDGSREYLSSLKSCGHHQVQVIFNSENTGFIAGMNQGMSMSDADYVCLANNDMLFTEGWLEEILSVFESNKNIGLLNPNSNNLGFGPRQGQSIDEFARELRLQQGGCFVEMPFCIGFCLVICREVIRKVGFLSTYLDFMFFEDTDYSMKVTSAGYLIGMAKKSYVWHQEHASFDPKSRRCEELMKKNLAIFTEKWGRLLRIAWMIETPEEMVEAWPNALRLARQGNQVSFYAMFSADRANQTINEHQLTRHTGVRMLLGRNILSAACENVVKKKKNHIFISKNRAVNFVLSVVGVKALPSWEETVYQKAKFAHSPDAPRAGGA